MHTHTQTPVAKDDYEPKGDKLAENRMRFRGGRHADKYYTFPVTIMRDEDDEELQEFFSLSFVPVKNGLILPPEIQVKICGGKNTDISHGRCLHFLLKLITFSSDSHMDRATTTYIQNNNLCIYHCPLC